LVAVKVLNSAGTGTTSDIIAGMNWVVSDCVPPKKCTANMSLGGTGTSLNAAASSLGSVVTLCVAAGNSNDNACNYSPSGATNTISVGATSEKDDTRAYYSNYGYCVSIFAPGSNITSSWIEPEKTKKISGTSMATPHVTGVVALILGSSETSLTPQEVNDLIVNAAQSGVLTLNCPLLSLTCRWLTPNKFLQKPCP